MCKAWDLSFLLRLLAQADEQMKQLEANLGDASAADHCRSLVQQISAALEEAVSMAKLMDSEGPQQPAWPDNAAVELPRWNSEGMRRENSETVLKEQERREMCKKRKTLPKRTIQFRSPAAKRAEYQKTAIAGRNTARRRSLEPGIEGTRRSHGSHARSLHHFWLLQGLLQMHSQQQRRMSCNEASVEIRSGPLRLPRYLPRGTHLPGEPASASP
ncbi:unnamed protein product [Musa textilis]